MRLARYGAVGAEKPAIVDADGRLRDLSAHVADVTTGNLAAISKIDPGTATWRTLGQYPQIHCHRYELS
jgi:2,4-didehydro-3-deoxy-L-rhamnonate hydrolase